MGTVTMVSVTVQGKLRQNTGPCPVNVILNFGLVLTQCNLNRLQLCLSYMVYTDKYYKNSI